MPEMTPTLHTLVRGNNGFAFDLYARLRAGQPGNLFFSPYSISSALAMAYAGARGETAVQMAEGLRITLPPDTLHANYAQLGEILNLDDAGGYRLRVANRLWGQAGYAFLPDYLRITRQFYGAEPAEVDFGLDPERARRRINAWVEDQTEDKIKDLIAPGTLQPRTRLVLTNAIYFKGAWTTPFEESATSDAPFFVTPQESTVTAMMHQTDAFRYAHRNQGESGGLQVLALPYGTREDVSMVILLPDARDGLSDLEARLQSDTLDTWLAGMHRREVRVYLPRFTMNATFELADVLRRIGMTLAFAANQGDFSGMSDNREISLSGVIHKAFIDVDEAGTEAAAATAIVGVGSAAPDPSTPPTFRADHPFAFLIRDDRTGSILFLGRMVNPTS